MTSPRQLSGIMKAGVACDRDLIKLGETRLMIVKQATLHCVRRRGNETLQSDTKFYKAYVALRFRPATICALTRKFN